MHKGWKGVMLGSIVFTLASAMASIVLTPAPVSAQTSTTGRIVFVSNRDGNQEIYLLSKENPEYAGMGTTLVMALIQQGKVVIANVGDSRAYYLTGGQIKQITRDHSVVQSLIERGMITAEEARYHPQRSSLTRALGVEAEVKADIYDINLLPGDLLLLCSDGLTDSLRDEEIGDVISSAVNLDEACANLITRAKEGKRLQR